MNPFEINLNSNKGFLLEDFSSFWVVVNGEVDVYYVSQAKGETLQQRNYLYTAQKGSILFGLNPMGQEESRIQLLVASPNSKLVQVNKSSVSRLEENSLANKITDWVESFSCSVSSQQKPRIYDDIANGVDHTFKSNTIIFPSNGLKWLRLIKGSINTFGPLNYAMDESQAAKICIPCNRELWAQSLVDDTELGICSTQDLLSDEILLMLTIHHILNCFLQSLKQLETENNEALKTRFENKRNIDAQLLENSLQEIKGIVQNQNEERYSGSNSENSLLRACEIIGDEEGFDFRAPKFVSDYENNTTGKLEGICRASKVRIRKVILRGQWWKEQNGHLLAFIGEHKEPVALLQADVKGYSIQGPNDLSPKPISEDEVKKLDPVAYMFLFSFNEPMTSISKIWNFGVRGLRKDAFLIIFAAFAGSLLALLTPVISGILFDDVIPNADRSYLLEIIAIMAVVGVVTSLLNLVRGIFVLRVETKSNINIQAGLMDHLLRLPVTFFRGFSAGDLTQRVLGINAIRSILSNTVLTAVLSGAFSIVNLCLIFYYNSKLAWIAILLAAVAVIVVTTMGFLKLRFDRQLSHNDGQLQGFLFEMLSGISKIRITGTEKRFFALWAGKFKTLKELSFKSGNLQNYVEAFNSSFPLFTYVIFFIIIFNNTKAGANGSLMSVGVFMAFISAFNQFLNDCLRMSISLISSLNMIPLYERLQPILEEQPESSEDTIDPGELGGEIEFNSVNFRYDKDQPLVLNDVSFKIKQGEMIAFVGPSGSGKSTVLRLLLGFEQPESGVVYFDGQDFGTLNKDLVRRQIGVVLQNGALMAGSIYKNIVGNSELTLSDAEEAAMMSGLEEDIAQMPMGMHTVISEGAGTFSGGQKQRLMIARSIVHKPRLLFMDEATSALDNQTQKLVSESLDKLQATRLIIAHRLSTIINADRIFVMDKGRIVESGTYKELINSDGLFAKLAQRQIA